MGPAFGPYDSLGKSLFLVNRSFLPGEVPYDSSREHVGAGGGR